MFESKVSGSSTLAACRWSTSLSKGRATFYFSLLICDSDFMQHDNGLDNFLKIKSMAESIPVKVCDFFNLNLTLFPHKN